jgi:hypothetical protein
VLFGKKLRRSTQREILPRHTPGRSENRLPSSTCVLAPTAGSNARACGASEGRRMGNRHPGECVCRAGSAQREITAGPFDTDVVLRRGRMIDEGAEQRGYRRPRQEYGVALRDAMTGISCSEGRIVLAKIFKISTITESWGMRRLCEIDVPGQEGSPNKGWKRTAACFSARRAEDTMSLSLLSCFCGDAPAGLRPQPDRRQADRPNAS